MRRISCSELAPDTSGIVATLFLRRHRQLLVNLQPVVFAVRKMTGADVKSFVWWLAAGKLSRARFINAVHDFRLTLAWARQTDYETLRHLQFFNNA
jgi:hypothetical protein